MEQKDNNTYRRLERQGRWGVYDSDTKELLVMTRMRSDGVADIIYMRYGDPEVWRTGVQPNKIDKVEKEAVADLRFAAKQSAKKSKSKKNPGTGRVIKYMAKIEKGTEIGYLRKSKKDITHFQDLAAKFATKLQAKNAANKFGKGKSKVRFIGTSEY